MNREEFEKHITNQVDDYINYYIGGEGNDPQIRVNPESLDAQFVGSRDELRDIAFSDEAIEQAAAADDAAAEDAGDFQASQDPDYYSLRSLVVADANGKLHRNTAAITALVDTYFK